MVINGDESANQEAALKENNEKKQKFREAFHFSESSALFCTNKKNTFGCKTCYSPSEGNQTNYCGFLLRYGDGSDDYSLSATGVVAKVPIQITDVSTSSNKDELQIINIILKEGGDWPTKVDGILGLGFAKLNCNPTCFEPTWMRLFNNPVALKLCFGDKDGFLKTVSSTEIIKEMESMKKENSFLECEIPIQYRDSYYTIPFVGVGLMNTNNEIIVLSRPNDFAIVDSGTTLLLLPEVLWDEFTYQLEKQFKSIDMRIFNEENVCLTELPAGFPDLLLTLKPNGEGLIIPPTLYFIEYYDKKNEMNVYCLGIQKTVASKTIIGDSVLRYKMFSLFY